MDYIGGMYRVWVYGDNADVSLRMVDDIKTEQEARAIANREWLKPDVKRVKITRNGFDSRKRRKAVTIAEAVKV